MTEPASILFALAALWPIFLVSIGLWALFSGRDVQNGQFSLRSLLVLTAVIAFDTALLGLIIRSVDK